MCRTVYVPQPHGDDLEIATIGALRNALNVEPELFEGVRPLPDDACLCQCDIKATALQAGYVVDDSQWDGWTLTPNYK